MTLDDLERLAKAATPGPRHAERFFREGDSPEGPARYRIFLLGAPNPRTNSRDCDWTFADAHFIAAFDQPTVLKLLAVARAARAWADSDECDKFLPNKRREQEILDTLAALEEK